MSGTVSAVTLRGTDLFAAGSFTNAGSVNALGIAKWNGANWSALGSGLYSTTISGPGSGLALATMGNDVFVGGTISLAGDKPSLWIARWNDQLNFYPTPYPMLTRSARLSNNQFQFRLIGTSGESYIIQASSNLTSWNSLLTNSLPLYDFTDTNAVGTRFYRAVLGP
jgi:hypothetical protein